LIESSIGKTVSGLRKHDDSVISKKADEIKTALKKCVVSYLRFQDAVIRIIYSSITRTKKLEGMERIAM
jgi:hypothetical protein